MCCNELQCVEVRCSALQCVTVKFMCDMTHDMSHMKEAYTYDLSKVYAHTRLYVLSHTFIFDMSNKKQTYTYDLSNV